MTKVIELRYAHEFEFLVFEVARQLLAEFEWPALPDYMIERPAEWPLSDKRFDRPHGKPGKFHGLTLRPREYLKQYRPELPPLVQFGLHALSWWHREVWQAGSLRNAEHQSFNAYVRSIIPEWGNSFGCEAELRVLYGMPSEETATAA